MTLGVVRTCADRGFHHHVSGQNSRVARVHQRLRTGDESGGDHGHTGVDKFGQVRLVGVPADDSCVVEQACGGGDDIEPIEELVVTAVVVPRGSNNRRVELLPVRCGGVPIDDVTAHAEQTQRRGDQRQVGVVFACLRAADESNAGHRNNFPACRTTRSRPCRRGRDRLQVPLPACRR